MLVHLLASRLQQRHLLLLRLLLLLLPGEDLWGHGRGSLCGGVGGWGVSRHAPHPMRVSHHCGRGTQGKCGLLGGG